MKKTLAIILSLAMLFSLAACGSPEPLGCEGKYISVATMVLGMVLTGEDSEGMELILEPGGKGSCTVDGVEGKLKWTLEGTKMTLTVEGETTTGDYSKDKIECKNFMGLGADVVFAIAGSAAADPSNYMSEDEKPFVGQWYSYAVTDVLGDPMPELDAFGLFLELNKDHSATVRLEGETLEGGGPWSVFANLGSFDEDPLYQGEETTITFEMMEDGKHIELTFDWGELYCIYTLGSQAEAQAEKARVPEATPQPTSSDEGDDPISFYAVYCAKDGEEFDCINEYVELLDEDTGVVRFDGGLYNMTWTWYDDDSFEFVDEDGDAFEGYISEDDTGLTLTGSYAGFDYVFKYAYFPVRFQAISCEAEGEHFTCDQDYVEFLDEETGVVSIDGTLFNMAWTWYEDDSFEFVDEDGDVFEGYCWGNTISGSYAGYEYVYTLVA